MIIFYIDTIKNINLIFLWHFRSLINILKYNQTIIYFINEKQHSMLHVVRNYLLYICKNYSMIMPCISNVTPSDVDFIGERV